MFPTIFTLFVVHPYFLSITGAILFGAYGFKYTGGFLGCHGLIALILLCIAMNEDSTWYDVSDVFYQRYLLAILGWNIIYIPLAIMIGMIIDMSRKKIKR